jgi:hypothetical protein
MYSIVIVCMDFPNLAKLYNVTLIWLTNNNVELLNHVYLSCLL